MAGQYSEVVNAVLRGHTVKLEPDVATAATLRTVIWRELKILKAQEKNLGIVGGMGSKSVSITTDAEGCLVVRLVFPVQKASKGVEFTIIEEDKE